ncbi:MAG: DUF5060 domain-containing protein [Cyclobacteriaceae bacterium]
MNYLSSHIIRFSALALLLCISTLLQAQNTPLYRVFEQEIQNSASYANPFTDVELNVQYQSPSGLIYNFYGFYDGDGKGGYDGDMWKVRFMPNETGTWKYTYSWTDKTKGGKGSFRCDPKDAGPGIIQAYGQNPRWMAYNSTDPVWLKSYYETGHGSLGQDFNWIVDNVYQPLKDNGYNHLQVNWLLSLCCFGQYYLDGPKPETLDLALYQEGDLFGTMNMDVWKRMEQHLGWLNDHDMGVHMFLGVDGSRNEGPDWTKLSSVEKDKFVRYMVARLAPFANLAGWNFVWEVPGDREDRELGFARLIEKYDIFNHLRTYEDEFPRENEYGRIEYSFAAVENHQIAAADKDLERNLWKEPWTHHMACLLGYQGKPVFMSEGNALWRRFWQERTGASQDDLRRSAWACATAGASFTWNGHAKEYELYAGGESGLPFNDANPYKKSQLAMDVLSDVMTNEVNFSRMVPNDALLENYDALNTYALVEEGSQYLVFTKEGRAFSLELTKGKYEKLTWIDSMTGEQVSGDAVDVLTDKKQTSFDPPNRDTDWVLVLKKS